MAVAASRNLISGATAAAALYPPYDDYQAKAGARKIPVVVLEKRAA